MTTDELFALWLRKVQATRKQCESIGKPLIVFSAVVPDVVITSNELDQCMLDADRYERATAWRASQRPRRRARFSVRPR